MNYLKSALAGFGMSFIGTALCGAKTGGYHSNQKEIIEKHLTKNILMKGPQYIVVNREKFDVLVKSKCLEYCEKDQEYIFGGLNYQKYAQDYNVFNKNYWYNPDLSKWSIAKAFLINNIVYIPTALLGALFHDKVGRDLTPKINSYFDSEISPYLVTGGVFGILGTVGMAAHILSVNPNVFNDPTQPWIYSFSIIEGFVIGATAMAGAYFGDEKSLDKASELESTVELDFEKSDQQIDI